MYTESLFAVMCSMFSFSGSTFGFGTVELQTSNQDVGQECS